MNIGDLVYWGVIFSVSNFAKFPPQCLRGDCSGVMADTPIHTSQTKWKQALLTLTTS